MVSVRPMHADDEAELDRLHDCLDREKTLLLVEPVERARMQVGRRKKEGIGRRALQVGGQYVDEFHMTKLL